ncbi:MAG TPA: single-stranded DNA-binding protein [Candidatus Atopostipes pullistercoris]|uniref:Single-stranded DNA-binding protein n=1 Tax=Candidatus Atopostipes pullistercoris TaxID=2838467 RepID=A0A9D2JZ35_9LACT|nr:single-stranded DNA-binding protein [Candidatus Atopostipes pullistercoris]
MINNTTLVGRLTRDPELRYTGSGIAVVSFNLAVERNYTNAQGERETDFINCVAWRGLAETLANFSVKGSLIGITGSIQTRNYQNNEGRTVYITEVVADNFQMLEPKSVTDSRRNQTGGGQQASNSNYGNNPNSYNNNYSNNNQSQQSNNASNKNTSNNNDNPFANIDFGNNEDPFESNEDVTDISDDDLPF